MPFLCACKRRCSPAVGLPCTSNHARPRVRKAGSTIGLMSATPNPSRGLPSHERTSTARWQGQHPQSSARPLRARGIAAIFPGPKLSRRPWKDHVYPSVVRTVTATSPTHGWGMAITSRRMPKGGRSLLALLDGASRSVRSWELDMPFVLSTVPRALVQAVPSSCTRAQGSHVTSPQDCAWLRAATCTSGWMGKDGHERPCSRRGCGER